MRQIFFVVIATVLGLWIYGRFPEDPSLATGLAILAFIATLWLSEAIHITATALLVPLLATLTGLMTVQESLSSFASPIIFLFLGGFALAAAMRQHKLDNWLAEVVMRVARGNLRTSVLLLFVTTAWISMWISNTATTVMMLPIAMGLLEHLKTETNRKTSINTQVFVLLGVAYSANIGGIGTLVGSPPNAIAASVLGLDFVSWLKVGLPLVILLLPVIVALLWIILAPKFDDAQPLALNSARAESVWTPQARWVLAIFLGVVSLWLMSRPLAEWTGITKGLDAMVAVLGAVLLIGGRLLTWQRFEQDTEWGVLLLFGGGISLSVVLSQTGASGYLADQLVDIFSGVPGWLFLALAIALMIFLTEISSNTASAALFIPIFYSLPQAQIGLSPVLLSMAIAAAASCAFMLPVATPPNAIVFGTGMVQQRQMMRVGLVLNLSCILMLSLTVPLLV